MNANITAMLFNSTEVNLKIQNKVTTKITQRDINTEKKKKKKKKNNVKSIHVNYSFV